MQYAERASGKGGTKAPAKPSKPGNTAGNNKTPAQPTAKPAAKPSKPTGPPKPTNPASKPTNVTKPTNPAKPTNQQTPPGKQPKKDQKVLIDSAGKPIKESVKFLIMHNTRIKQELQEKEKEAIALKKQNEDLLKNKGGPAPIATGGTKPQTQSKAEKQVSDQQKMLDATLQNVGAKNAAVKQDPKIRIGTFQEKMSLLESAFKKEIDSKVKANMKVEQLTEENNKLYQEKVQLEKINPQKPNLGSPQQPKKEEKKVPVDPKGKDKQIIDLSKELDMKTKLMENFKDQVKLSTEKNRKLQRQLTESANSQPVDPSKSIMTDQLRFNLKHEISRHLATKQKDLEELKIMEVEAANETKLKYQEQCMRLSKDNELLKKELMIAKGKNCFGSFLQLLVVVAALAAFFLFATGRL